MGGKGGSNKRKTNVLESVVSRGMSPMWGAREEVTNEKTTFEKVRFFRGLPMRVPMSPMWGAREEVTNEKTTFEKVWFIRGLPIRVPMSPMWVAREEVTNEKPTF